VASSRGARDEDQREAPCSPGGRNRGGQRSLAAVHPPAAPPSLLSTLGAGVRASTRAAWPQLGPAPHRDGEGRLRRGTRGPSWRSKVLPLDPGASDVGEPRRRPDPAASVAERFRASGGVGVRRFRLRRPHLSLRRAPPRAPAGVLPNSGWNLSSPMLVMDHRTLLLVATIFPTPGSHTCMATKVLHLGSPKDCRSFHPMRQ